MRPLLHSPPHPPPPGAPSPQRGEGFFPSNQRGQSSKVGRFHTFNGSKGALRPFLLPVLTHQCVYQMSTKKAWESLRRRGPRLFPFQAVYRMSTSFTF